MTEYSQAIVVIPEDSRWAHRWVLGLTNLERVLYSLYYAGVRQVAFLGETNLKSPPGLEIVSLASLASEKEESLVVVPGNALLDRGQLKTSEGNAFVKMILPSEIGSLTRDMFTGVSGAGGVLVHDQKSFRRAKKHLKNSLRKPIDGLVSRNLNRHLSIGTTSLLVHFPLRPNHWTVVFTLIGILGGVFAAVGTPWYLVVAGLCFQGQSILDGCDGELARLRFQFSKNGQWLDSIGDDITNYTFCFGLAAGVCRVQDWPLIFWLGVIVLALQILSSGVLYRRMIKMGTGDLLAIPDAMGESKNPIFRFLRQLAKRDTFVFIIAGLTIAQLPLVAFLAFGIGTFFVTIGVLLNERHIRRLEQQENSTHNI